MSKNRDSFMLLAEDCVRDARLLLQAGSYRGAVNRAYYGYFDAVRALLSIKNISTKSHQAARSLFGEHFVKQGPFSGSDARNLHALFNLRQNSDYDPDEISEIAVAEKAVETAAEFVLQVGAYLRERANK
ncbi:MAG: HEPN domain-containing protein [Cytophagaceae bacterium]|nr:MAG: HEPN domain-containing protein [Cytophagaceae bacterium]